MNQLKALFVLLFAAGTINAQELYTPRNIKEAYVKGSRSIDGKPGKNYWQNHGKYDINITVDEKNKLVSGKETILYTNNSPDTLTSVTIRFVNNIHKPESPRSGQVSKDFLSSGLKITSFSIDGKVYQVDAEGWETVADITLKNSLLPNKSATFTIEWNYPLSKQSGREGQIDNTTFFVAYAYPRISVYDDYNGWDRVPHSDRTEFYNDFNDYKLAVNAPKNYVVWATGDLQNPDEVLQEKYAERLKASYTSDEVIKIASTDEMNSGLVTKQNAQNTWRFAVNNISDITFSLSNSYVWDAGSVIADQKTKRRVSVQAAYHKDAPDFPHAVEWSKQALEWFSVNWPGVPYPYSKMTAFQGFADMEYPMMVNDSSTPDPEFSQFVLNHEIAHTYFPFYMGTNETRYAFMDEGWATTLEYLIGQHQLGKDRAAENFKKFRVKKWISDPSSEQDQPIISMSTQVSGPGYGNNAYGKPALAYLALKDMLGDATFKKALQLYMDRWNGKHPMPWDFFYSINDGANQDLNWYWNNWFFSNNYIDLAITRVTVKGKTYALSINNIGGFAVPFDVLITYADGKKQTYHQTPEIWKNDPKQAFIQVNATQEVKSITIDGGIFMDADATNNFWWKK